MIDPVCDDITSHLGGISAGARAER